MNTCNECILTTVISIVGSRKYFWTILGVKTFVGKCVQRARLNMVLNSTIYHDSYYGPPPDQRQAIIWINVDLPSSL